MEKRVVIIGAGAAGLTAARMLARKRVAVQVLEARDRIGGRIHTVRSPIGNLLIELGAEFVHGERNATWDFIRRAGLETNEVPDRHWQFAGGRLSEAADFWDQLETVFGRINPAVPDQDFQSFLDQAGSMDEQASPLAFEFVEGFHAAAADRIGTHALAKAEQASESDGGTHQFRIRRGYGALLEGMADELQHRAVKIHAKTVARSVRWEPGQVEITADTPAGSESFQAFCALITVPLGVLQAADGIGFEPRLTDKEAAIRGLAMGAVVKLTLQFKERFWPVENFGFIHCQDTLLPTWWADARGPLLTAWVGGPRAEALSREEERTIEKEALRTLSAMFKVEVPRIRELLVASYT